MRKIFVYSYNLELGGVERSLLGLLESLPPNEFQVDLFLAKQEGELLTGIPEYINVLPVDRHYQAFGISIKEAIKQGFLYETFARLYAKIWNKAMRFIKNDSQFSAESFKYHRMIISKMRPQPREYDIAISFAMPYFYILTKVKAKIKIGWIHTDYQKIHINCPIIRKMFSDIDYIAPVSEAVKANFESTITGYENKTVVVENILSQRNIEKMSEEKIADLPDTGSYKLLSVGRYCVAKNFDNAPDICRRIIEKGVKIKWYLIGFGTDESLIREKIKDCGMEENVILLGKKDNPYPYIKNCDLYVQPSRFEGNCVCVHEAQMLGKPVVITAYPTSSSQLEDGIDGVIVPMDNEGCADGIAQLLRDPERMKMLSENCKKRDYSNKQEVEKIYSLLS